MVKLTPGIKKYIINNIETPDRKLKTQIDSKFNVSISHVAIGNFRRKYKKQNITKILPDVDIIPIKEVKTSRITRPTAFPLSIDQLNSLLQSNKDHYWYEYLNKQFNGRLRSDFQKLLEFIRDTVNLELL